MVDRQQLLADLKPLVRTLEADLRTRCDEVPQINVDLQREYNEARSAGRTGATFEAWRTDLITQVAVSWVLSCVFVRFLEDNDLISPPRISGPQHGQTDRLQRARDEWDLYLRSQPDPTYRGYLLSVFDELAKLPGTKDVFGPHNPVSSYRNWLSGDAGQNLIRFFQKTDKDGTGEIIHDFTDAGWDTRFLGDLYQDLSEAAKKKYALLQTPVFVEEFILERTLEPAINEFGLKSFRMIDPACGSGHFLLGAFVRVLRRLRQAEPPGSPAADRELINRALQSVHGVDLNPYAVAIARFRLLIAAMRECQITKLRHAPDFRLNLAVGDSLLHGVAGVQEVMCFHGLTHVYQTEDSDELKGLLRPGTYHAVVANPPYITPKDKALNQAYRDGYPGICHGQYHLSAPFMARIFDLAASSGFAGQITDNAFMKREFGKKLVESFLPTVELTHMIDTSLAFIPGHGTPTVILLGRNRSPVTSTLRAVRGIKREDEEPADPAAGQVWMAILRQIDQPGSESDFVSVADVPRETFYHHPWSIGGGGAAELKEMIDESSEKTLGDLVQEIGRTTVVGEDEIWIMDAASGKRLGIGPCMIPLVVGDCVRDWWTLDLPQVLYPYLSLGGEPIQPSDYAVRRYLMPFRSSLRARSVFGKTMADNGRGWWEHLEHYTDKLRTPMSIAFAFVATHNHFVLDRGGKVFKQSAPVIKLPAKASEEHHLGLLGLLNSATGAFWMRQVFHDKGGGGIGGGIAAEGWERFLEYDGTKVKQFPLPAGAQEGSLELSQRLDVLARQRSETTPRAIVAEMTCPTKDLAEALQAARDRAEKILGQMVALQEELDWVSYGLYGLIDSPPCYPSPPALQLGQRAFEIVLARKMAAGQGQTTWFARHNATPVTEILTDWPEDYRRVVQRRIEIIETVKDIALIERPEYKRRWNVEPWDEQQERALRTWLLERLESYFDLDGRMRDQGKPTACGILATPRLTSAGQVADLARNDEGFMQVAEIYTGRMDFDVAGLVSELIAGESVPCLPVLRYRPSGLDKRAAWERTWQLQRLEDAVDALFDVDRLKKMQPGQARASLEPLVTGLPIDDPTKPAVLRELLEAQAYVALAVEQKSDLTSETVLKPVRDSSRRAQRSAVGDIPVPPKYTGADFLGSSFWRLRGKLDVPKERWVSFPHCEGEDGTLLIAWAGYDHAQMTHAITEHYELVKERQGRTLVPLLACIGQMIPWLKQWHNEPDPSFNNTRMGDEFENYLAEEAKALGMSVEQVMDWTPPERVNGRGRKKKATSDTTARD